MVFKMNNTLLVLCAVLAIAAGHINEVKNYNLEDHNNFRTDDYINLKRFQHSNVLHDLDSKLERFNKRYLGRLEVVNEQLDMVTDSIVEIEDRLNPLEVLSDLSKQCVRKYRHNIPNVTFAKAAITQCVIEATNQITNMLSLPIAIRNGLNDYYNMSFLLNIKRCDEKYVQRDANYTACITSAVSKANSVTIKNQKSFEVGMDAAECSANAYLKKALDCNYSIQTNTISQISKADVMINKCLEATDECKPCDPSTCPQSTDWEMDNNNRTMLNPFYLVKRHPSCLILKLK